MTQAGKLTPIQKLLQVDREPAPKPAAVEKRPDLSTQSTHEPGALGAKETQDRLGVLGTQLQSAPAAVQPAEKPKWKDSREQLNLKLPGHISDKIRRYAFERRITVTAAIIEAIERLPGTQSTLGSLGTQSINLPTSDDDLDDDDRTTLALYAELTGNAVNERDRALLRQHREYGHDCLRLALLIGRQRYRGSKINALAAFANIFREIAGWPPDKIAPELAFQMHQHRRKQHR